jgi:hypothetical protein
MKKIRTDYCIKEEELEEIVSFLKREKFGFGLPEFLSDHNPKPMTGEIVDETSSFYDMHGRLSTPNIELTLLKDMPARVLRVVSNTRLEMVIDKFYQKHKS